MPKLIRNMLVFRQLSQLKFVEFNSRFFFCFSRLLRNERSNADFCLSCIVFRTCSKLPASNAQNTEDLWGHRDVYQQAPWLADDADGTGRGVDFTFA